MLFKFSYSLQDFDGLLILPTSPIEMYFIHKGGKIAYFTYKYIYFFFTIYFSSIMIFFFWVVIKQKKNNKKLVPLTLGDQYPK